MKADWIFSSDNYTLQQEFSSEGTGKNPIDNTNDAQLSIDFPHSFSVNKGYTGDEHFSQLTVDIPADVTDKLAIAWCKKRELQGTLGGPVGREFGSPIVNTTHRSPLKLSAKFARNKKPLSSTLENNFL